MILTCPQCATRYLVDDGEMRPEGRKVKCGACAEEWRVSADGEADPPRPPVEAPPSADSDPPEVVAAPVFEVVGQETSVRETIGARETTGAVVAEPPVLESLFVAPINTDSKSAAPAGSLPLSNLLLAVVILAVLAVAAFAFRVEIVRIAPNTAAIYSALGIPVKGPGPPLARPPSPAPSAPHG
jgi:predicted Zn finger-like uncharacterized protein